MNPKLNGHATKKAPALDSGDTIERLMRPYYVQLAKLAFDDANADHGLGVAFDLDNPYVQTVIDGLAKQVRNVTDTTKQQIADRAHRKRVRLYRRVDRGVSGVRRRERHDMAHGAG
jgi:hypothetical protein